MGNKHYEIYNSESGLPFRPIAQLQETGLELSKLTELNPTTNALKSKSLIKWFLSLKRNYLKNVFFGSVFIK